MLRFRYTYSKVAKKDDEYEPANFDMIENKVRVDLTRKAIFSVIEKNKELYEAFYHKSFDFPNVIFQKPYKDTINIYIKKGSKAHKLYSKFIAALFSNNLKIDEIEYKLIDFDRLDNLTIAPIKSEKEIKYNLVTPLLLFTKKKFPIYYAIAKKYTDTTKRDEELKNKAKDLIISNLKWQLQQLKKYKKYDILDQIDINWHQFNIRFIDYHDGEKKTPAIFGSFSSTWELPHFIGHKIGKGFGQINKAKYFRDERVENDEKR